MSWIDLLFGCFTGCLRIEFLCVRHVCWRPWVLGPKVVIEIPLRKGRSRICVKPSAPNSRKRWSDHVPAHKRECGGVAKVHARELADRRATDKWRTARRRWKHRVNKPGPVRFAMG